MRELEDLKFSAAPKPSHDVGAPGDLKWIEIGRLVVDPSYQRDIHDRGKANVKRIIDEFRWSRFAPLVVAPRPDGRFAIIDGQHRATAAKRHPKVTKLPCYVIACTIEEEAEAFAAINGSITALNGLQIFHAKIVACDPQAKALAAVCAAAGVSVPRNILLVNKPGQTLAIGALQFCLKSHGAKILTQALRLITQTGDGNTGLVRAPLIYAFCDVISDDADLAIRCDILMGVIERAKVAKLYETAQRIHAVDGGTLRTILLGLVRKAVASNARKVAA